MVVVGGRRCSEESVTEPKLRVRLERMAEPPAEIQTGRASGFGGEEEELGFQDVNRNSQLACPAGNTRKDGPCGRDRCPGEARAPPAEP